MFNVGDKVRIREGLQLDKYYGDCGYVRGMVQYEGKVATVTEVFDYKTDSPNYSLDIDKGKWFWDSEMLISTEEDKSYNKEGNMNMINYKSKTFSDEVVREMLSQPVRVTLEDTITHTVNKKLEEESVRLAKAVCEYEEIVHNLEQDLHKMLDKKNAYKAMYQGMLDMYNNLVNEYNELVDDYNNIITEYVFKD